VIGARDLKLVFVLLNQNSQDIHERSERMIFIFADFVRESVQQFDQLLIILLGYRFHCIDRTSSPWLKLVVDGILGVIPEFERWLGRFEPGDLCSPSAGVPARRIHFAD
jgi:hypothetical protein